MYAYPVQQTQMIRKASEQDKIHAAEWQEFRYLHLVHSNLTSKERARYDALVRKYGEMEEEQN
jgi:hypothetical protein